MRLFSDDNLAVCNIWSEARGDSFEGKIAVGEVMRTRTKRMFFSNGTLADTIFRPYQFSGFNSGNPWRADIFTLDNSDPVVRECFNAWIASEHSNLTRGAVLYCNLDDAQPQWAIPEKLLAKIDKHSFFSD